MTHGFRYTSRIQYLEAIEEIKSAGSESLLEYMGWKDEYSEEAKQAFREFCYRFEGDILKRAEIACDKWEYNEVVALEIAKCTLSRVWKYPTYNHSKSKAKTVDAGIKLWLGKIIFTQLANYHNTGSCHQADKETDLTLVYSLEELAEGMAEGEEALALLDKISFLEEVLSKLSRKHKIIYFTYHLYENTTHGKNIPRSVTKKLREELELTQGSIRKYKEEAKKEVTNYLKSRL